MFWPDKAYLHAIRRTWEREIYHIHGGPSTQPVEQETTKEQLLQLYNDMLEHCQRLLNRRVDSLTKNINSIQNGWLFVRKGRDVVLDRHCLHKYTEAAHQRSYLYMVFS